MKRIRVLRVILLAGILLQICPRRILRADTGYDAWLRHAPLTEAQRAKYALFPATVVVLSDSPLLQTSQNEFIRGVRGMLQRTIRVQQGPPIVNHRAAITNRPSPSRGPFKGRGRG